MAKFLLSLLGDGVLRLCAQGFGALAPTHPFGLARLRATCGLASRVRKEAASKRPFQGCFRASASFVATFFFSLLALFLLPAHAANLNIAVAANVEPPMREIAAAFTKASGHQAGLAIGSTGKFYAQIANGAPFDILLSADSATPAKLVAEGRAEAGSRFTYAIGRLVLWSRDKNQPSLENALQMGDFKRLAIANPPTAPYGAAAMQTLSAMKLADKLAPKIVQGESVAQVYQFVATGNAELGFVAMSQVMRDGDLTAGSVWVVPQKLYAPLTQDAVIITAKRDAARHAAAQAFMQFLRSSEARSIFARYGYLPAAPSP
jgi:molybdate transport system substrate-binding protein